jgi:hypothetical protein
VWETAFTKHSLRQSETAEQLTYVLSCICHPLLNLLCML